MGSDRKPPFFCVIWTVNRAPKPTTAIFEVLLPDEPGLAPAMPVAQVGCKKSGAQFSPKGSSILGNRDGVLI